MKKARSAISQALCTVAISSSSDIDGDSTEQLTY